MLSAVLVLALATADAALPLPACLAASEKCREVLPAGTPLKLMVWNEVSTRDAKPGDRFFLVVENSISMGSVTVIPRGAKAWGEVTVAGASGMAGRAGHLEVRLMYVEVGGRRVAISGSASNRGQAGTLQVVLATAALTPWGPFARGNNARLKAGLVIEALLAEDVEVSR